MFAGIEGKRLALYTDFSRNVLHPIQTSDLSYPNTQLHQAQDFPFDIGAGGL
jgi:hypothetical protein